MTSDWKMASGWIVERELASDWMVDRGVTSDWVMDTKGTSAQMMERERLHLIDRLREVAFD